MSNSLSAFNAQLWSKQLVIRLDQVNVMKPRTNRKYDGALDNIGDTIQVRTPGDVSLSTYTKNSTTLSYQDLAPSKEPFTISDASYFAFDVDDVDSIQNDLDALDIYAGRAAVGVSNTVESKILTVGTAGVLGSGRITGANAGTGAVPGTVTVTNGAVSAIALGTAGSGYGAPPIVTITGGGGRGARAHAVLTAGAVSSYVVDHGGSGYTSAPTATVAGGEPIVLDSGTTSATGIYQQFVKARGIMSKASVPFDGRWAAVDPDSVGLLLEDTAHFVRATSLGDSVVTSGKLSEGDKGPGFVGRCAGFDVYEVNHLPTSTVDSVAAKTLLFGDDLAISYAAQILSMEALRLQSSFANAIRGLLLHDAIVFDECSKRLVSLLAAA